VSKNRSAVEDAVIWANTMDVTSESKTDLTTRKRIESESVLFPQSGTVWVMKGRVRISGPKIGEWMDMQYEQESDAKIQIVRSESLFAIISAVSVVVEFYGEKVGHGLADRTGGVSLWRSVPVKKAMRCH
jgi:hypothetical protein